MIRRADLCLELHASTQCQGQGPSGGPPPSSWPIALGPPTWLCPAAVTALPAVASNSPDTVIAEAQSWSNLKTAVSCVSLCVSDAFGRKLQLGKAHAPVMCRDEGLYNFSTCLLGCLPVSIALCPFTYTSVATHAVAFRCRCIVFG